MNYFKNIFKSIHQLFWLRYTTDGKEYAKNYKQKRLEELKTNNVEEVWVSYKLPLLVFLFPVILPMAIFGDIIAIILQIVGL